jgi:hypothetical protein
VPDAKFTTKATSTGRSCQTQRNRFRAFHDCQGCSAIVETEIKEKDKLDTDKRNHTQVLPNQGIPWNSGRGEVSRLRLGSFSTSPLTQPPFSFFGGL